jgi:hypothetical protein
MQALFLYAVDKLAIACKVVRSPSDQCTGGTHHATQKFFIGNIGSRIFGGDSFVGGVK